MRTSHGSKGGAEDLGETHTGSENGHKKQPNRNESALRKELVFTPFTVQTVSKCSSRRRCSMVFFRIENGQFQAVSFKAVPPTWIKQKPSSSEEDFSLTGNSCRSKIDELHLHRMRWFKIKTGIQVQHAEAGFRILACRLKTPRHQCI